MRFPSRAKAIQASNPPKSWRQHLLAISALLAFISLFAANPNKVATPASLRSLDSATLAAFETAHERGLRPSLILAYSQHIKLKSAGGQKALSGFLNNLESATTSASAAGILVPSDRFLLELTLAFQDGLSPESAADLISTVSPSTRLARLERYRLEREKGLPPASAVTRAVLIR